MTIDVTSLIGSYNNLNDPTPLINRKATIIALVVSFQVAASICASLRLYARFFIIRAPGWDDFFTICYWASTAFGTAIICQLPDYGMGRHFITLSLDEMAEYLKRVYWALASYCMSTAFIKISLLFQYLRIYQDRSVLRIACIVTLVLVSIWGFAFSFLAWFPCVPLRKVWDFKATGKCYGFVAPTVEEFSATFEIHAGLTMAFDIIVFLLPVPIYFQPETTRRTRMGLLGLFPLGAMVVAISLWRLISIVSNRSGTYPTFDPSWYTSLSIVLSALEIDVASIGASLPVFWPVLSSQLAGIFVTKEVQIQHEERKDYAGGSRENFSNFNSRQGSDLNLDREFENQVDDSYIRSVIFPVGDIEDRDALAPDAEEEPTLRGTASVHVESTMEKDKKWKVLEYLGHYKNRRKGSVQLES